MSTRRIILLSAALLCAVAAGAVYVAAPNLFSKNERAFPLSSDALEAAQSPVLKTTEPTMPAPVSQPEKPPFSSASGAVSLDESASTEASAASVEISVPLEDAAEMESSASVLGAPVELSRSDRARGVKKAERKARAEAYQKEAEKIDSQLQKESRAVSKKIEKEKKRDAKSTDKAVKKATQKVESAAKKAVIKQNPDLRSAAKTERQLKRAEKQ